jgi:hypothetical protein
MSDRLNAEFDVWFAKVKALSKVPLDPSQDWAELWFDGYSPEEALEDYPEE